MQDVAQIQQEARNFISADHPNLRTTERPSRAAGTKVS